MVRRAPVATALALWAAFAAGCAALAPEPVRRLYPNDVTIAEPLNMVVTRQGRKLTIDNRTGRAFENVQLWLNHQYGMPVTSIPTGVGAPLDAHRFTNHFGEHYPTGTFLQPELDRKLVLVDLYDGQNIHKLTVNLEKNWHLP